MLWGWDQETPALLNAHRLVGHTGYVKSLAFSPDGTRLASASLDKSLIVWDTATGAQVGPPLAIHSESVNALVFGAQPANHKSILISGSSDRTIILWDLATRRPVLEPERGDSVTVKDAQRDVSADGNLAAEVDGQSIRLTEARGGAVHTLSGQHTGPVNALVFSPLGPDGKLFLASGSDDQTVVIWDVTNPASPSVFLRLTGFQNPIKAVQFTAYLRLLVRDESGQATRVNLDPENWQQLACAAIQRSLTREEWTQYFDLLTYDPQCK
jgi:WD40 repeat protein